MAVSYSYIPTTASEASNALNKVFASMANDQAQFLRSASSNLIIVLRNQNLLPQLEEMIESFSLVHPSRVFAVCLDEKAREVKVEVSARCHGISKSDHVCSEVVKIVIAPASQGAVPNILRAHLLTGLPTELFLFDPAVDPAFIKLLAPITEQVILDSGDFEGRLDVLAQLSGLASHPIDLQWVGLGAWRDQIRIAFDRPNLRDTLNEPYSIEISAQVRGKEPRSAACGLLLAGWLVDRLRLKTARSSQTRPGRDVLDCQTSTGTNVTLSVISTPSDSISQISDVVFRFAGSTGQMKFHRGDVLETVIELGAPIKLSRPLEEETQAARIRRYFLVGESIANYNAALKRALDLSRASSPGQR